MSTIACTLAPSEYRDRIAELSRIRDGALLSRERIEAGERLTFREDVEAELRAAIAAEAACCSFLAMRLERRGDTLLLDVTGPPEAQPVIAELFA